MTVAPTTVASRTTSLPQDPNFLTFWAGQTVSLLGSQVSRLALPLTAVLVLQATPQQMGLIGVAQNAPWILVPLFAGVLVDRLSRRRVMIAADLARCLLLLIVPACALLGLLRLELLLAIGFLASLGAIFFRVAHESFLPSLVGSAGLVEGNSKLTLSRSVADVAGPGLAGALVQIITAPLAVVVDACSFAVSAVSLLFVKVDETPPPRPIARASFWEDLREGVAFVIRDPYLRPAVIFAATINFCVEICLTVYVLFVTRELGLGAATLGTILALGGIGFLPGSLLAARLSRRWGIGPTILVGAFLSAATTMLTPLARGDWTLPLLVAGQLFPAMAFAIGIINMSSVLQAVPPEHLRGRVSATQRAVVSGTPLLGALVGGYLGGTIGLRETLIVAAVAQTLSVGWLIFSPFRTLRDISLARLAASDDTRSAPAL